VIRKILIFTLGFATLLVAAVDVSGRFGRVAFTALEDHRSGLFLGMQAAHGVCNVLYARSFESQSMPPRFGLKFRWLRIYQRSGTFGAHSVKYEPSDPDQAHGFTTVVMMPSEKFLGQAPGLMSAETELLFYTLPLILILAPCPLILLIAPRVRRWHRRRKGRCLDCGYSMTGNTSGVCPECGQAVRPETLH